MKPRDPGEVVGAPDETPEGPVRTCVGCRERGSRSVLVRVTCVDGHAVVDVRRSMPGRGAWLHPDPDCLTRAVSRRAFQRALRMPELDVSGLRLPPRSESTIEQNGM